MRDPTECPPADLRVRPDGVEEALALVRRRGGAAQLCVLRDGAVLIDRAFGCDRTSLFWLFSASKPYIAMLVHLLAQRGQIDLDEPVARYWPRFAAAGKEGITIRHVLQHRAGLPVARSVLADGLVMANWARSVRHLERARPAYPPGAVPAYHLLSYGFILGEVVQRVTGKLVADVLTAEILDPLGLTETYLGLPARLWSAGVPVRVSGRTGRLRQATFNRRATRRAVIPAAGISATARDLAGFYQALLDGGAGVFTPATIEAARMPSTTGERDRFLGAPVRWAQGFQLGGPISHAASAGESTSAGPHAASAGESTSAGPHAASAGESTSAGPHAASGGPDRPRAMGGLSSPLTFGHNGSNACIGWADPTRRLVFAYTTDLVPGTRAEAGQQSRVADAILAACY